MALLEINFFSRAIGVCTAMSVVLPERADHDPWPVLILLHDAGGDHTSWLRNTNAARYAEEVGVALVMPDGLRDWYADMKYGAAFRKFIGEELPAVSREFCPNLSERREDTIIAGAEMGGYGAWAAALTYPETFSRAFAVSPVLDPMKHLYDDGRDRSRFLDIFGTPEEYRGSDNDLEALAQKQADAGKVLPRLVLAAAYPAVPENDPEEVGKLKRIGKLGYRVCSTVSEGVDGWDFRDAAIRAEISEIARETREEGGM